MKPFTAFLLYFSLAWAQSLNTEYGCKCAPTSKCWPTETQWTSLNSTLNGALIRGVPPGSVCYPDQPNYNIEACKFVASQWFNSTWHATDPVSVDYPIWTNNSCNPIWPNGTSITGDPTAGSRGCSIGAYPAYVVKATTPQQVSSTLKWASQKNIRVIVKSTGHSYPGRSIGYGSLSIWTHHFRGIEYMENFKSSSCPVEGTMKAVRVAAGHTGIEVQAELAKHNAIIVTGANPDVGLVGWLTGGGHGTLSQTYGMGADNLLEATIVTPNGDIIHANPCQTPELFFAIRGGGGGTYGVVTEVVVKAFPSPKTTSHTFRVMSLSNTATEYYDFLGFLHVEMQRLKEGGMQGYYVIVGPPVVPTLSFTWTFMAYDKPQGTVESLMKPIETYLNNRAGSFQYDQKITHADKYFDIYNDGYNNEAVATGDSAYGSRLLSPESLSNATLTAKLLAQIGPSSDAAKPNAPFANPIVIGHMIASPNTPTFFPSLSSTNPAWRKTLVHLIAVNGKPSTLPASLTPLLYADITHNKTAAMRRFSPYTGAYFNEADSFEPEWQESFFGQGYGRLRRVKDVVDPAGVLWCRRCVGSERWVERGDGWLCRAGGNKGD
ncbi:hypothetical protein GQ44DRAFT_686064 [Phaeosphaeriaceae sp. PMI808]|nr:hypothetical protein GQ44DRAFT_686064 [Phaeosphaeriaceae sp. PMI808]